MQRPLGSLRKNLIEPKGRPLRKIIGVLVALAGLALAFYVGVTLMFVGGFAQVVDSINADPTDGAGFAWGMLRIMFSFVVGVLIAAFSVGVGDAIAESGRVKKRQQATAKTIEQNWKRTIGR